MSIAYSVSRDNVYYGKRNPQGQFLDLLIDRIGTPPDVYFCDTMDMPHVHHIKQYMRGVLIVYCWWDPANAMFTKHLDDLDIEVILVTPDVNLAGKHPKQHVIKWKYQYGLHLDLIAPSRPAKFTTGKNFLCMMRNHKSERIQFLQHLWQNNWIEGNLISYLGQINTPDNGRADRNIDSILKESYFVDSEFTHTLDADFKTWCIHNLPQNLPNDRSKSDERSTDFYSIGNIEWYDATAYSVVLETYWAKTNFLTEKTFKPIIAQHPFVNLGNYTTKLLKELEFDIFEDVVDTTYDSKATDQKIKAFAPVDFDIDPRRPAKNLLVMNELRLKALQEQNLLIHRLEDSLTNLHV